jgi:hypothetical protein
VRSQEKAPWSSSAGQGAHPPSAGGLQAPHSQNLCSFRGRGQLFCCRRALKVAKVVVLLSTEPAVRGVLSPPQAAPPILMPEAIPAVPVRERSPTFVPLETCTASSTRSLAPATGREQSQPVRSVWATTEEEASTL